jgi:hypothetical protein
MTAALFQPAVVDLPDRVARDRLLAERDENTCRKDFAPSELLALGRQLEELERPKATERQREGGRLGASITNHGLGSMEPKPSQTRTDEVVGEALGISRGTYLRLKTVDDATSRDDGAGFLRQRANRVRAGTDGITWDDPAKMARALSTAAIVLGL